MDGTREEILLPVLLVREGRVQLYDDSVQPVTGDRVDFTLNGERGDEARTWLEACGWKREASQPGAERQG